MHHFRIAALCVVVISGTSIAQSPTTATTPTARPAAVFTVNGLSRTTTVNWSNPQSPDDSLYIEIRGDPAPGHKLGVDADGFTLTKLFDDAGNDLLPKTIFQNTATAQQSESGFLLRVVTGFPSSAIVRSISIIGKLHCFEAESTTTVDFPNATQSPQTCNVAGYPVTVAVRKGAGGYDVQFSGAMPDDADPDDYQRFLKRLNETWVSTVKLMDAIGTELRQTGGRATLARDHIDIRRHYVGDTQGSVRLLWTVPTAVDTLTIPVQLDRIAIR